MKKLYSHAESCYAIILINPIAWYNRSIPYAPPDLGLGHVNERYITPDREEAWPGGWGCISPPEHVNNYTPIPVLVAKRAVYVSQPDCRTKTDWLQANEMHCDLT